MNDTDSMALESCDRIRPIWQSHLIPLYAMAVASTAHLRFANHALAFSTHFYLAPSSTLNTVLTPEHFYADCSYITMAY
jgi:hypothetical protein